MWRTRPLVGAMLALALALACSPTASGPGRPNVVLFLVDDVGYGDLGCYGHPFARTPRLDRFAGEAVRLTRFYASSPNCSPSRGSLLTGRIPARLGLYDVLSGREAPADEPPGLRGHMKLREEEHTLAELLSAAGYDTLQLGKWHLDRSSGAPVGEGDGGIEDAERDPDELPDEHHRSAERHGFDLGDSRRRSATEIVEHFIEWAAARPAGAPPFFAFLSTYEVHEPLSLLVAPAFRRPFEGPETAARARALVQGDVPRTELADDGVPLYFGALAQIDAAFGRLIDYLDRSGQRENTIVVFTSDNGPEYRLSHSCGSTGGLRGAKGRVYEGGLRVPALVAWPARLPRGSTCSEPIVGFDLLPTLSVATGVRDPHAAERDGLDVLPALAGGSLAPRDLYWGAWAAPGRAQYALLRGPWKVVASTAPLRAEQRVVEHIKTRPLTRFELYDLQRDPGETRDLAAEAAPQLAPLAEALERTKERVTADGPDWDLEEVRYKARGAWPRSQQGPWSGAR